MEYVEQADPKPEPISIARCRELLGEDAELMSDQDIEDIRRHAETMGWIVVEMYQERCRLSE
jgi:type IV secretory pathway ATPase VirB11/archaellum biosynthesis ATPase